MAVDKNPDMIANVWPGKPENAHCSQWSETPLPDKTVNLFLCDGGITCVTYPAGVQALAAELRRIADPPARAIIRLYVPPSTCETKEQVLNDLAAGKIPNLSQFKLRIATAMETDPKDGVALGDIWDALQEFAPDREVLTSQIGWRREHLDAIDSYRGSPDIPTLDQVTAIFNAQDWRLTQG
jgi:hypothetical protein